MILSIFFSFYIYTRTSAPYARLVLAPVGGWGIIALKNIKNNSFLVPFFTTMEVVAPLEKDPILSGRSIRSFRYLELQNLLTGYDFIHIFQKKNLKSFLVPFFTTIGVVAQLKNYPILSGRSIQSFRHLELQNPSIISDFRHRSRIVQQFRNCCMQQFQSRSRRRRSRRSRSTLGL